MARKRPTKQLSPSEWRVMQVCWTLGRTTIRDILMALSDRPPAMSYTTVHMLLTRIAEKGYVTQEQDRGINYYTPAQERSEMVRAAAEDFVDNILAGEPANLEILDEVLGERKPARQRVRKPS